MEAVLRHRRAGLALPAAIAAAARSGLDTGWSFFARIRAARPDLETRIFSMDLLSALSWAVEDEYCARAERPVLLAGFQRQSVYRRAENRWRELSRTAAATLVFADFDRLSEPDPRLLEVPLDPSGAARREWVLVCDSVDHPACVVGWELADPRIDPPDGRRFETVWSLEPEVVREATRTGLALLARVDRERAERISAALPRPGAPASGDLRRANRLFVRVLAYADRPTYPVRRTGGSATPGTPDPSST